MTKIMKVENKSNVPIVVTASFSSAGELLEVSARSSLVPGKPKPHVHPHVHVDGICINGICIPRSGTSNQE